MKKAARLILLSLLWTKAKSLMERPNRRIFLSSSATSGVVVAISGFVSGGFGSSLLLPDSDSLAEAAPPITQEELEALGAKALRYFRPKPPRLLRPRMNKDFAVLLMRSSYNSLDELDCVPMDQFQRDFFIIRQAEYEPYVNFLGPGVVQQGDLTDPYYFDFISFAQYLAINREITLEPPYVFEERQPVETGDEDKPQQFITQVVRRDPSLTNDLLSPEHSRKVGTSILNYIDTVLGDTGAGLPKFSSNNSRPTSEHVLASFDQLVKIFIINGYAWNGSAELLPSASVKSTHDFALTLGSPATLWGSQCLQQQRATLTNQFLLKAATQLAQKLGYLVVSSSVRYQSPIEITKLQLR